MLACSGVDRRLRWGVAEYHRLGARQLPGFLAALPGVGCTSEDAGKHITEGDQEENDLREKYRRVNGQSDHDDTLKGMTGREVDFLSTPEAPGTHH